MTSMFATTSPLTQFPLEQILEMARWAPSADNTQPWYFRILSESHVEVHELDARAYSIYDLDGRTSHIAIGGLLETVSIAAREHGLHVSITRRDNHPEQKAVFDVHFSTQSGVEKDSLFNCITARTTQRRCLQTRRLTDFEKAELAGACGSDHQLLWFEATNVKWRWARLLARYGKLRLTMPEAYEVHARIVEWNTQFSDDKIPDQAIGLDPLTLRIMRWVMRSWARVNFFNRYLAGSLIARLQLDLLPGVACGAHYLIIAKHEPKGIDDYISAGRAAQRFWLTATKLGLQMQPEMTPLIFSRYVRSGLTFTKEKSLAHRAEILASQLESMAGNMRTALFMGRIGAGRTAIARSIRLPLERLDTRGY